MKKITIASVTLLVIGKVKIYVMVDSYNHVCKFHIDYSSDENFRLHGNLSNLVKSYVFDSFGESNFEFSETSKNEVFKYLPSKFC